MQLPAASEGIAALQQCWQTSGGTDRPLWQHITGFADREDKLPLLERRQGLKKLLHHVCELIGAESSIDEALPEEEKSERTVFWNPLPEICFHLGIARTKLTAYVKELTGLGAYELVDRHRVRGIKIKIRDEFRVYAREWREEISGYKEMTPADKRYYFGNKIRNSRRAARLDRATQALRLRVPTHARLYRACVVAHNQTPQQIEDEVAAEVLRELEQAEAARPPQPVRKKMTAWEQRLEEFKLRAIEAGDTARVADIEAKQREVAEQEARGEPPPAAPGAAQ